MIHSKIREQGNSYVVTIPRDQMAQLGLRMGDTISFKPVKTETGNDDEITYVLSPELQKIADEILEESREALEHLANY